METIELVAIVGGDSNSTNMIRGAERHSIFKFVEENASIFKDADVLDYGCGREGTCAVPQPYRVLVEEAGCKSYTGWELGEPVPCGGTEWKPNYDVILCTQVLGNMVDPWLFFNHATWALRPGGRVLLTYPTTWWESEASDFWRFTRVGMEYMVSKFPHFSIEKHEARARVRFPGGLEFTLGYGLVLKNVE